MNEIIMHGINHILRVPLESAIDKLRLLSEGRLEIDVRTHLTDARPSAQAAAPGLGFARTIEAQIGPVASDGFRS